MLDYNGRTLDISDELLSDYKYYVGTELTGRTMDLYLFNRYAGISDNPIKTAMSLSNEEIAAIVINGMRNEIRLRQ